MGGNDELAPFFQETVQFPEKHQLPLWWMCEVISPSNANHDTVRKLVFITLHASSLTTGW